LIVSECECQSFAWRNGNPFLPLQCLYGGQNPLVPALDAEPQKSKPYQSDVYMTGFNAIPRQAREQDSFDTPSPKNRKGDVFKKHLLFYFKLP